MSTASEDPTLQAPAGTAPALVPDPSALDTMPSGQERASADVAPKAIAPGTLIDRFVVLGELGRGAMGIVLSALDPDLERRVAIKLLSGAVAGDSMGAKQRLVQEARAMARLSHPNVVGVFQVGTFGDQVYLAMELVRGRTLRTWMQEKHTVGEILRVFTEAGRGLAAAHEAGIVHRDFKPDNVFVGDDGRVRVGDFGLAGRSSPGKGATVELGGSFSDVAMTLTASGSIMGTPAYMSPEQFASSTVDARSDQFAFCVALFEALYGERPFRAESLPELSSKVVSGQQIPAPVRPGVTKRVRRALAQGLRTDPSERHPDMTTLLAALYGRPWWWAPAFGSGVVLLFAGLAWVTTASRDPCAEAESAAAEIWTSSQREAAQASFARSGRPHAETSWRHVDEALDGYREGWGASRREACEASKIRGSQSDELFDRRVACLDRRRGEVDALVAALSEATAEDVDEAVAAVDGLAPLDACADARALMAEVPPPEDPRVREQVDTLRDRLSVARAKLELGRYEESRELAAAVLEEARALDYGPLTADAAHVTSQATYRAGDVAGAEAPLREGLDAAARGGAFEREAELLLTLVYVVGYRLGRPDEGLGLERAAHGAILRAGGGDALSGKLETNMALVLQRAGRYDEAKSRAERGLELLRAVHGENDLSVASATKNLGNVLRDLGDADGATAQYRHALEIRRAVLGPRHPVVAETMQALGLALQETDRDAALLLYEDALKILRDTVGDVHPSTAEVYLAIGSMHFSHGDMAAARVGYQEALDRYRALGESAVEDVVGTSVNLGNVLVSLGEVEEGTAMLQDALVRGEAIWGAEHPQTGLVHEKLGLAYYTVGDYTRAVTELARAAQIREASLPFDHPDVAESLFNLGSLQRVLQRYDDAEATLARAGDSYAAHYGQDHPEVASVHEELGVIAEERGDLSKARAEYERALAMFRKHLPAADPNVVRCLSNLADAFAGQGETEAALSTYDEALALREAADGVESPSLCFTLLGRGAALLPSAPDRGLADLERCVSLRERDGTDPMQLAFARFELAKALMSTRRDRQRALALADEARAQFLTGGSIGEENVAEIDAWRRAHGGR